MLVKVSPWKGIIMFQKKGNLGSWYIGPFTITTRVGKVAYRLDLPEELSQIHNTFHVSQLRKCVTGESTTVLVDKILLDEGLNFIERPISILDRRRRVFGTRR